MPKIRTLLIMITVEVVIIVACLAAGADAATPHGRGAEPPITIAAMVVVGLPVTIGLGLLGVALWVEEDDDEEKGGEER